MNDKFTTSIDYPTACKMVDNKTIFYFEDLKVGDFCKPYASDKIYRIVKEFDVDIDKYGFQTVNCIEVETEEYSRIGGDVPVLKVDEPKYQLRLTLTDDDYCILEEGNFFLCQHMLDWHKAHERFFNGTFSIVRREI